MRTYIKQIHVIRCDERNNVNVTTDYARSNSGRKCKLTKGETSTSNSIPVFDHIIEEVTWIMKEEIEEGDIDHARGKITPYVGWVDQNPVIL